jgi:hypothetical protein
MIDRKRFNRTLAGLSLAGALTIAMPASAYTVAITEWQYNGSEFVEFTNLTSSTVDMTGWSFDDDTRMPGSVSLSAFGNVAPGESVILSEVSDSAFRATWGLPNSVKVIGLNTNNLGRDDEINLYDAANSLVDRLTFGDDINVPGTIRTQTASGNPSSLALLDQPSSTGWVLSQVGDAFGSHASVTGGFVGNPGTFVAPVPLPAGLPLLLSGLTGLAAVRRRARARDVGVQQARN